MNESALSINRQSDGSMAQPEEYISEAQRRHPHLHVYKVEDQYPSYPRLDLNAVLPPLGGPISIILISAAKGSSYPPYA